MGSIHVLLFSRADVLALSFGSVPVKTFHSPLVAHYLNWVAASELELSQDIEHKRHVSERAYALSLSLKDMLNQRTWLYPIAALVFTIFLWLAYRLRVGLLKRAARNLVVERTLDRERLVLELNDTLIQGMQGLILLFEGVAVQVPTDSPFSAKLEDAIDRAERVMVEGRDSVRNLCDPGLNLPNALRTLLAKEAPDNTECSVVVRGQERELKLQVCDELLRTVREAVLNAFQHASAAHVWVTLSYHDDSLDIHVADDGVGIRKDQNRGRRGGIRQMEDRTRKLKSSLQILDRSPSGTEIVMSIPSAVAFQSQAASPAVWSVKVTELLRKLRAKA